MRATLHKCPVLLGLLVGLMPLTGCGSTASHANLVLESSTILVIGDSWVTGGSMNSGPTWPHLLGLPDDWEVASDAAGGSGYMGDEEAMSLVYGGRLDRVLEGEEPEVVLVAMGRNDIEQDPDEVIRVARADLLSIDDTWPDAEIVVFSPFSSKAPGARTNVLTRRLERLAEAIGMEFLDVSRIILGQTRFFEDLHPNDLGHELIAKRVASELRDQGVLPPG